MLPKSCNGKHRDDLREWINRRILNSGDSDRTGTDYIWKVHTMRAKKYLVTDTCPASVSQLSLELKIRRFAISLRP